VELGAGDLHNLDEPLQVSETPIEPVGVIDDDHLRITALEHVDHPLELRAPFAPVGGDVVVDQDVDDCQTSLLSQVAAQPFLTVDADVVPVLIVADPGVDHGG
jgi:hypothetical protein